MSCIIKHTFLKTQVHAAWQYKCSYTAIQLFTDKTKGFEQLNNIVFCFIWCTKLSLICILHLQIYILYSKFNFAVCRFVFRNLDTGCTQHAF